MADRPDIESGHLTTAHVAMLLDRAADGLTRRLGDVFSPETIREVVQQSYDLLDATAQVRTHLPVLAGRFTRDRLQAIAKNQGTDRDLQPGSALRLRAQRRPLADGRRPPQHHRRSDPKPSNDERRRRLQRSDGGRGPVPTRPGQLSEVTAARWISHPWASRSPAASMRR